MKPNLPEIVATFLHKSAAQLSVQERRVLEQLAQRRHVSQNTNQVFDEHLTFGQRVADRVAAFGGSWTFILLFGGMLLVWIILNSLVLVRWQDAFDPYPYILLNLLLSMLAALQAPVIMMSQNRQSAKDRLDAAHDYEVNLKAELDILALHEKIDALRDQQITELVAFQQEQIRLLTLIIAQQNGAGSQPHTESR